MFDGSTSGRGFETALAPWLWGILVALALVFWVWHEVWIRRGDGDSGPDDDDT